MLKEVQAALMYYAGVMLDANSSQFKVAFGLESFLVLSLDYEIFKFCINAYNCVKPNELARLLQLPSTKLSNQLLAYLLLTL